MEKWILKKSKDPNFNYENLNIDKLIYNILLNRKINTKDKILEFLNPKLEDLNTPLLLPNLIKASNLILEKISSRKKIRIIGDYDVDGVMSSYILFNGLKTIGAIVDFKIPHRVNDGYGINKRLINEALNDKIDLLITCDNGIAAIEEVSYAMENSIDVIITDHHEPPINQLKEEIIPLANAVINPKIKNSKYPFKDICGAVVAYKLISYLFKIKGMDETLLYDEYLPYAAMATICDVMPLINENRIIVNEGLKRLNKIPNNGIKALIDACDLSGKFIDVYHIGFIIGPTINASGRLESAELAIKLLIEEDYNKALEYAKILRKLNSERQALTEKGIEIVDNLIKTYNLSEKLPVLILRAKGLEESVLGIIAGRIKEKYNHPTIVLTNSKELLKGSGRSIEEYNMFEKISESKHFLTRFGGHKMACGLSLEEDKFKDFVVHVNNNSGIIKEDLIRKIYIDAIVTLSDINNETVINIDKLKPFGNKNPKPLFGAFNLHVEKFNVFGKNRNVIKLVLNDGITKRDAILFEDIEAFKINLLKNCEKSEVFNLLNNLKNNIKLDIVFTPNINNFRGVENLELNISNYRISEARI
ncbi:MAG: single-stranded-DNA-specific exonuclease RecJ [Peptoniphilaceae bacterium]